MGRALECCSLTLLLTSAILSLNFLIGNLLHLLLPSIF